MIGARKTPCLGSDPGSRSPSRQPLPHPLWPRICFVAPESLRVKFLVFFANLYQPLRTHAAAAAAAAASAASFFSFGTHRLLIARAKFLEGKSGGEENHGPYASSVGVCAPFFPTPSPAFLPPVLISKLAGCPRSFPCLLNFLVAGGDVAIAFSFLLRLLHTVRETETVLDLHGHGGKMLQSIGLTLLVIVATLFFVLLFMLCGE